MFHQKIPVFTFDKIIIITEYVFLRCFHESSFFLKISLYDKNYILFFLTGPWSLQFYMGSYFGSKFQLNYLKQMFIIWTTSLKN